MSFLIARVMSRIVEVGECLEWTGGYSKRSPRISYKGKLLNVRRALAIDAGMLKGDDDERVAVVSCMNWRCVRPEHVQLLPRSEVQRRTSSRQNRTIGARKVSAKARKHAKINAQIAAEIRSSTETQREIAKRYGISQALVYAVKKGRVWREYTTAFDHLVGAVI